MTATQYDTDVCVVGAGLAGLMAADELQRAGLSVRVFEAQAAVGGRVRDAVSRDNVVVELGANWFSGQQPLIKTQIARFGIDTLETHNEGHHLIWWDRKRSSFRGAIPSVGLLQNADIIQGMARFDRTMGRLASCEPWSESLAKYDHQSFGQWIESTLVTRMGKDFFRMVSEMVFGVEADMVSLLYVLYYSSRSTSLSSLISVAQGHQEFRFKKGPTELCEKFAASVGPDRIQLRTPVRSVRLADGHVDVETASSRGRYRALLFAIPPSAVRRISFSPPRPTRRERFLQALPMGRVIKVQAVYERPYWIEQGLSGQVMSNHYPLSYTIDNSPADRQRGVLAGFVGTSHAERFMKAGTDRERVVADAIDEMFGGAFPKPTELLIEDWAANEWIGGSYGAYFPPGVMTRMGKLLREQDPPIYWCGAEYGQAHPCQMEGALDSGQRSARMIIAALAQA
jgi:monoamine oxidase